MGLRLLLLALVVVVLLLKLLLLLEVLLLLRRLGLGTGHRKLRRGSQKREQSQET